MSKGALSTAAIALLLSGCGRARDVSLATVGNPPSCVRPIVHVTVVGDSLARGWGASAPRKSFASLVYSDVRRTHPGATMHNLGIPGATTDEIAAKEVPSISDVDCSLIVVISGANDVQKLYTPRHFGSSYTALLRSIRTRSPHAGIVVVGLPDVSLSPRIPLPLKPVESWLSRDDNASIADASRTYGASFVPLYALSHREAYRAKSLLSGDGIHPNDFGYRLMAQAASPAILALVKEAH